jgi:uncharacterized protein with HEPN domain
MFPPESRDSATIVDMIHACANVVAYTHEVDEPTFRSNGQLVSAVSYQILILGEAVTRLSDSLQARYPEIPWKDIRGMRHHLVHRYDQVALSVVWEVAAARIPALVEQLRAIERDLAAP